MIELAKDVVQKIRVLVGSSKIAKYDWKNRGRPPMGYLQGMAMAYAHELLRLKEGNAATKEMASPVKADAKKDALAWYQEQLDAAGISPDPLRRLFVLMIGLGMRESSGRYSEGRDTSATNVEADTAEAGLFQTSWDIRTAHPSLPQLFGEWTYKDVAQKNDGLLSVFAQGVHAKPSELQAYGEGEGKIFQVLSKQNPLFAVQIAAVGLRNRRTHWGPINRHEVEIRPEAEQLLQAVEAIVNPKPAPSPETEVASTQPAYDPDDEMIAHGTVWLQWALNKLGEHPKLIEDGKPGPMTKAAIKRFQERSMLPITGAPDDTTFHRIDTALASLTASTQVASAPEAVAPSHVIEQSKLAENVPTAEVEEPAPPKPESALRRILHKIFS